MLQSGSVRRMSCRSTTTWSFAATALRRLSWLNLPIRNGAERQCAQNRIDNGGWQKTAHEIWAKRCRLKPRRLGCIQRRTVSIRHRNVRSYVRANHPVLDRHLGANDQATDESLIINQLWNDQPETIAFLPPDFNVSMLQTPSGNQSSDAVLCLPLHWPSKPHLDRCHWQRSNPPSCHFLTTANRSNC